MSEPEPVPDDLKDLIDEYLSGAIDEARLRLVEERLCADAAARRWFVRYCRLHTDLHLEMRARRAGSRALRALDDQTPEAFPQPPRRFRPGRWLAAAALLAVALGVGWWLTGRGGRGEAEPEEVAWLVNAQNCQWAEDPPGRMQAGTVLGVDRGLAEVRFRSGARVVLEGPARLELLSGNAARLLRGRLSARVPEPAVGFEVLSPRGKVVDLGTEFGVSVADGGDTDVYVFEGKVNASGPGGAPLGLSGHQAARIDDRGVALRADPPRADADRFVRAIVAPPALVPRSLALDFRKPVPGSLRDVNGLGTGLTHRLPGTGRRLLADDANLRLDTELGQLELTTTNTDINRQVGLDVGEYLGLRLSDLGFTGAEDFAVTVTLPNIPALKTVGQFGLYAGARSDRNIRGGLISRVEPGQYTLFLVNNNGGRDADSHFLGLLSTGDDLRVTLKRTAGKFALVVENLTTGSSSTLAIRHPDFLDGERDLYVGLFGANTRSEVRKTLVIKDLQVTVWTVAPQKPRPEGRG
jgi:hypothetical protein